MSPQAERIVEIVQQAASAVSVFEARGPGQGNRLTNEVMTRANTQVRVEFGREVVERAFVQGVVSNVDYYLEETREVIEVEFSLKNPYPCLEKDVMKVLLARDAGFSIDRLILVGGPGGLRRVSAPAPRAIRGYLERVHGLDVEIHELTP